MVAMVLMPLFCRQWVTGGGGHYVGGDDTPGSPNYAISALPPEVVLTIAGVSSAFFFLEQLANLFLLPPFECWPFHKQVCVVLTWCVCQQSAQAFGLCGAVAVLEPLQLTCPGRVLCGLLCLFSSPLSCVVGRRT